MLDNEDSFVLSIFIVGYIYIIWIQIVKVYFFAALFAYARGEHYIDPWFFDAVDESADTLNVGRVGDDSSGYSSEIFHPLEKIVAGMIPNFVEPFAVSV